MQFLKDGVQTVAEALCDLHVHVHVLHLIDLT